MRKKLLIVFLAFFMVLCFNSDGLAKKKKEKLTKEQKAAAKVASREAKIEKVLGTRSNWKPSVLLNLRKGMSCAEAAKLFKGLNCRDRSPFKKVSKGLGTVSDYKFYFQNGRLHSVTLIFGARLLDEKYFNRAMANVVVRKWGPVKDTKNPRWRNNDYDDIKLKYNKTHWELEVELPELDPGDIDVAALDEGTIQREFQKFLGGNGNCLPAFFAPYKYHMSWQDVAQMHPDLKYDTSRSMNSCIVSLQNHPILAGLKFRFDSGLLEHIVAIFHWQIDRELFKELTFGELKVKYGSAVKDESAVKDRISIYTRECGFVTREWATNRWHLSMTLPKKDGVKGAVKQASAGDGSLTGNWLLVATKEGKKVADMKGDIKRVIEFTPGQQLKMKENGKVVMSSFYKVVGKTIFLTAAKGGTATKTFGRIVSRGGNKLGIKFSGKTVELIFQKI